MTNADLIKGMTESNLAQFLFKWQVICGIRIGLMETNKLLNAVDMKKWLESTDNTIINNIMSADWAETEIDFTPFISNTINILNNGTMELNL